MKFDRSSLYMDYSGQELAEKISKFIIVVFGIIGFVVGYLAEQMSYSMIVLAAGFVVAGAITLPPWPMYRKNAIKWRKPQPEEASVATTATNKSKIKKRH